MKFILLILMFASSLSQSAFAVSGNMEDLVKDANIINKLGELEKSGWVKSGTPQLVPIQSFYYTNNSQGKTLLLVQPIYGARYLMTSCLAAVFRRGGSVEFGFVGFTQVAGQCQL